MAPGPRPPVQADHGEVHDVPGIAEVPGRARKVARSRASFGHAVIGFGGSGGGGKGEQAQLQQGQPTTWYKEFWMDSRGGGETRQTSQTSQLPADD